MSHSEQTTHYGLPKYIGTDIINPLTDFNDAADAIDEALYDANTASASAVQTAQGAVEEVGTYDARITSAQGYAERAITKANNTMDMIAKEFDPLKQGGYAVGDTCIYNDVLYEFINVHTGAWDASDVKVAVITEAVESTIEQGKADIEQETQEALAEIATQTQKVTATQEMIANVFHPDRQYYRSDICYYADKLYTFAENHLGPWTGTDVSETDVEKIIRRMHPSVVGTTNVTIATTWGAILNNLLDKIDYSRITYNSKFMLYGNDGTKWRIIDICEVSSFRYNASNASDNYVRFTSRNVKTNAGFYLLDILFSGDTGASGTKTEIEIPSDAVGAITGKTSDIMPLTASWGEGYGIVNVFATICYY